MPGPANAHHFTVDVEEYFHPTAVARHYPMADWDGLRRRTPDSVPRLLELLAELEVTGTFFVLGWLAEQEPQLVRSIVAGGHELASHGYEHALVGDLGPDGFRESVRRSRAVLEELAGTPVLGYRAPSFSIVPGGEWAFDVLLEEGYRYDASLFPVSQHPTYGYPSAPADPHWIERPGGRIAEFPATTLRLLGSTLPASGGAYFRLLPEALVRGGLGQASRRGAPGMFYIHPWEFDDWAPEVDAPLLQRIRTFSGRARCWKRLEALLREVPFKPIRETLQELERSPSG